VADPKLVRRLKDDILENYLRDEKNARVMSSNGTYTRKKHGPRSLDAQAYFIEHPGGAR
jgi:polyphosphate kinase